MGTKTIDGTTYYFFKSTQVKVFSSAYRGELLDNGSSTGYFLNPESRMISEQSNNQKALTHWKRNYVVEYPNNNGTLTAGLLKCVIGGYYFEINISEEDLSKLTTYKYLTIDTRSIELINYNSNYVETTKVLSTREYTVNVTNTNDILNVSSSLDEKTNYEDALFYGITCTTAPINGNTDYICLKNSSNYGRISYEYLLPEIMHGYKEHSVSDNSETWATGKYSHAEGRYANASGEYSHAEGYFGCASGTASHIEGYDTRASGCYSHAEGTSTIANHKSQHVFGEYNIEDSNISTNTSRGDYVEIVGNGNSSQRNNARTLDWSGNEWLAGSLTANHLLPNTNNSYSLGDNTSGSEKLWKNLYLSGTAIIPTGNITTANVINLNVSTVAGNGITSNLIPSANNSKDLGSDSYRWKNIYVGTANISTNLNVSGEIDSNLVSKKNSNDQPQYNLGSTSNYWKNLFVNTANISTSLNVAGTVDSNLIPSTNNNKDLGNSSNKWKDLYLSGNASIPTATITTDNITTANITSLNVSTAAGKGVTSSLIPSTTASKNLGSANYKWNNAYINTTHGDLEGTANIANTIKVYNKTIDTSMGPFYIVMSDTMPTSLDTDKIYFVY